MHRRSSLAATALPVLALAVAPWRAIAAGTRVSTPVETEAGAFVIEVDTAVALVTVANYLAYVDGHLLDGEHRSIASSPSPTRHPKRRPGSRSCSGA